MPSYGPFARQEYWVHPDSSPKGSWLVIIHGGLWRDHRVTQNNGIKLATDLKHLFSGVASISYRLCPDVEHPQHMNDCALGLSKIIQEYGPEQLVLLGHSAGCYIAGQIAPKFRPQLVIGLEGLYDLDELVDEYPSLEPMISKAFPGPWIESRPDWKNVPLAIIHSSTDELVSMRQPMFVVALRGGNTPITVGDYGTHNHTFEQSDLVESVRRAIGDSVSMF